MNPISSLQSVSAPPSVPVPAAGDSSPDEQTFIRKAFQSVSTGVRMAVELFMPPAVQGVEYMWFDPQFCVTCHTHDYAQEGFEASVHAGSFDGPTCHSCHHKPLFEYPVSIWNTQSHFPQGQGEPDQPHTIHKPEIPAHLCGSCHLVDGGYDWPGHLISDRMDSSTRWMVVKTDGSLLHEAHLDVTQEKLDELLLKTGQQRTNGEANASHETPDDGVITCTTCHGRREARGDPREAHIFYADGDVCSECHGEREEHVGESEIGMGCLSCHGCGFMGESKTQEEWENWKKEKQPDWEPPSLWTSLSRVISELF